MMMIHVRKNCTSASLIFQRTLFALGEMQKQKKGNNLHHATVETVRHKIKLMIINSVLLLVEGAQHYHLFRFNVSTTQYH